MGTGAVTSTPIQNDSQLGDNPEPIQNGPEPFVSSTNMVKSQSGVPVGTVHAHGSFKSLALLGNVKTVYSLFELQ